MGESTCSAEPFSGRLRADNSDGGSLYRVYLSGACDGGGNADLQRAGGGFYGDMAAMIFCGVFFLFFHRQKFNINQRTAVACAAGNPV